MADQVQINKVISLLESNKPIRVFDKIMSLDFGTFGVLKFLYEKEHGAISKEVCKHLNVSSARMAIIVKKLLSKGLIQKQNVENDARATRILLTQRGINICKRCQEKKAEKAEQLLELFDFEHLSQMFSDMKKVGEIMHKDLFDLEGIKVD